MKVAVGSDHAGFELKEAVRQILEEEKFEVQDFGCFSTEAVDYPDIARAVALAVQGGECERGILCCGTGIGMSMTANKVPGIRAALCSDVISARLSRAHNDANILAMGGRLMTPLVAGEVIKVWLSTPFEGGRHARRIEKIHAVEQQELRRSDGCPSS